RPRTPAPAPPLATGGTGAAPVPRGGSGNASLCPAGTTLRHFDVEAIRNSVPLNAKDGLIDGKGELLVLRSQLEKARADPSLQVPLAIRANSGEDCVDILLRSEVD